MDDTGFAVWLNARLQKPGATIEASEYMTGPTIRKIIAWFSLIDPYVQAVVIQSVIALSPTEFSLIQNDYSDLIRLASHSEDDRVRKKAAEFRDFPRLTFDEESPEFNFTNRFDDQPMAAVIEGTDEAGTDFRWREEIKPPSNEFLLSRPPPKDMPHYPSMPAAPKETPPYSSMSALPSKDVPRQASVPGLPPKEVTRYSSVSALPSKDGPRQAAVSGLPPKDITRYSSASALPSKDVPRQTSVSGLAPKEVPCQPSVPAFPPKEILPYASVSALPSKNVAHYPSASGLPPKEIPRYPSAPELPHKEIPRRASVPGMPPKEIPRCPSMPTPPVPRVSSGLSERIPKKSVKKQMYSLEELQAERAPDYRPNTTRRK
jgi:hypothetical protein